MFGRNEWLVYALLAGLSWGTYVPIIFYGGSELGGKPSARLTAILCVGVAYFVIGVLFPAVYLYLLPASDRPNLTTTGLVFSGLAGVAGAVGAICVIFSTRAAVAVGRETGVNYKLFIAPMIFGLAPVINTLVSSVWHPQKGQPFHFALELPGWKLWLGILLVGLGAALVLFSKEEAESGKTHGASRKPAPVVAAAPLADAQTPRESASGGAAP
jgi:hypothetical protein